MSVYRSIDPLIFMFALKCRLWLVSEDDPIINVGGNQEYIFLFILRFGEIPVR